jgi:nicotinate-nucleotide adenylyltransferase
MRSIRVGWYGGSFNPPHLAHQALVLKALETLDLDTLLVAPAYHHAESKVLAPFSHRLDMTHWMLRKIDDARVHSSMDEWHAHKEGVSTKGLTVDTLAYVRRTYVEAGLDPKIYMLVGHDVESNIVAWEGYERLKPELDAGRVVLKSLPRTDPTSSTLVRQHLRAGHYNQARALLPKAVFDYIMTNGLYVHDEHGRASDPDSGPDEPDCGCRTVPELRRQCGNWGCGFCSVSKSIRDSDAL